MCLTSLQSLYIYFLMNYVLTTTWWILLIKIRLMVILRRTANYQANCRKRVHGKEEWRRNTYFWVLIFLTDSRYVLGIYLVNSFDKDATVDNFKTSNSFSILPSLSNTRYQVFNNTQDLNVRTNKTINLFRKIFNK